jgi:hypothetical protein
MSDDFPTLGYLLDGWIERHCRVPDGFHRKEPFHQSQWQFFCTANHYRIREGATYDPKDPPRNRAFHNRRSQIILPQKTGKGPWSATVVAAEAVGPTQFCGWAKKGDYYVCARNGCQCGWEFRYEAGDPMGERHPSPLIQLTATSEDQVDNVYRPLRAMIQTGPLGDLMKVREGFTRILGRNGDDPDMDRIDVVTSSALSRIGNPISFALQDESGLYTTGNKMRKVAHAQRRGAAGMGGRTIETGNAWDPAEDSVAQETWEAKAEDVFRYMRQAPAELSYLDKRQRRKIHEIVYAGSPWVDLDSIEAEAAELIERDPSQAARFFGNRVVYGAGSWLTENDWWGAYAGERLAS